MKKVKILGLSWSPKHGNTDILVQESLAAAAEMPGVETVFHSTAHKFFGPCKACYSCYAGGLDYNAPCPAYEGTDDAMGEVVKLMHEADGIIMGCPVYFHGVTAQLKAFMDRCMAVECIEFPWRNKVMGFVTIGYDRNGGQEHTITEMQRWAQMMDIVCVGVGPDRPKFGTGNYLGAAAVQGHPFPVSTLDPEGPSAVKQDKIGLYAAKAVGWRVTEMTKVMKYGWDKMEEGEGHWPPYNAPYLITSDD